MDNSCCLILRRGYGSNTDKWALHRWATWPAWQVGLMGLFPSCITLWFYDTSGMWKVSWKCIEIHKSKCTVVLGQANAAGEQRSEQHRAMLCRREQVFLVIVGICDQRLFTALSFPAGCTSASVANVTCRHQWHKDIGEPHCWCQHGLPKVGRCTPGFIAQVLTSLLLKTFHND